MPWLLFTADFDHKPRPGVTIAYRAGQHLLVTTACAERAVAAGKAVRKAKPSVVKEGRDARDREAVTDGNA